MEKAQVPVKDQYILKAINNGPLITSPANVTCNMYSIIDHILTNSPEFFFNLV